MRNRAPSAGAWLRSGWHVGVAYLLGFAAMVLVFGWHVHPHVRLPH